MRPNWGSNGASPQETIAFLRRIGVGEHNRHHLTVVRAEEAPNANVFETHWVLNKTFMFVDNGWDN